MKAFTFMRHRPIIFKKKFWNDVHIIEDDDMQKLILNEQKPVTHGYMVVKKFIAFSHLIFRCIHLICVININQQYIGCFF